MKKIPYITLLVCGAFALGCTRTEITPVAERVAVKLSGELSSAGAQTRGEGRIDPILADQSSERGLPPKQLDIGIMTIEINTENPTAANWGDLAYSPYLDRGFFGGNQPGDSPDTMEENWNGNIEYTDRGGLNNQIVFYSRTGEYYHFVCVYPYADIIFEDEDYTMQNAAKNAAIVYFDIDGSSDIMASNRGYGNNEHPFGGHHSTDPTDGTLRFYHKLAALRCKFVAESAVAKALYGTITSVELLEQPDVVGLNIGANALAPTTTALTDERTTPNGISYPAVGSSGAAVTTPLTLPEAYTSADAEEFGYVLALPAQKYTFRITTSLHGSNNPLTATYDFTAATPAEAGTIYNLTFTMLETAEIELEAAEAAEWWLDQTFD
jgi:hypothetical protein